MNGNETIKSAIDRACEINKWVAPRSELQALINICNKQKRLSHVDLSKMVKWFLKDKSLDGYTTRINYPPPIFG